MDKRVITGKDTRRKHSETLKRWLVLAEEAAWQ